MDAWILKCPSCNKKESRAMKATAAKCGHIVCERCTEEGCLVCGEVKPKLHDEPKEGR